MFYNKFFSFFDIDTNGVMTKEEFLFGISQLKNNNFEQKLKTFFESVDYKK